MKTVIEMAKEAGAMFDHMTWVERDLAPVFERLAELVRADEREACAKVCDDRAIEYDGLTAEQNAAEKLAAAIRARSRA